MKISPLKAWPLRSWKCILCFWWLQC